MSKQWRFPNAFGENNGLEDGNLGHFKSAPFASLAREICQNSIDARLNKEKPVEIEFKSFSLEPEDLLGHDELLAEFKECFNDSKERHYEKGMEYFSKCIEYFDYKKIPCLRISDKNTKGLCKEINTKGVLVDNFDKLFKGTGVSDKNGNTGGSKGVGKNAAFVTSGMRTVFYATKTYNGRIAFAGKCKVASRKLSDSALTIGCGYFTDCIENEPIENTYISLDTNYVRPDGEFGTDVFIVALRNNESWKEEMINDVLDSFLVAIYKNSLIVTIDDVVISKDTISDLIKSDILNEKTKNKVMNEYYLLQDHADIFVKDVEIDGFDGNPIQIRVVKEIKGIEPTRAFSIVRYPFMQIIHERSQTILGYSAIAIIDDNPLCSFMLGLEDITHKKWSVEDIDEPSKKSFAQKVKNSIYREIKLMISEVLQSSSSDTTDFEGANELMPEVEDDSNDGDIADSDTHSLAKKETPKIFKGKKPKRPTTAKSRESADSENYEVGEGEIIPGSGSGVFEGNENPFPKPDEPGENPGPHDVDITDGNNKVIKSFNLAGVKIDFLITNLKTGQAKIVFTSNKEGKDAYLTLSYVDGANSSNPVKVERAILDNNELKVKDNVISGFDLVIGKKYEIIVYTSMKGYFGGGVKVYAY